MEKRLRRCDMTARETDLQSLSSAVLTVCERTEANHIKSQVRTANFWAEILNRNYYDYESDILNYQPRSTIAITSVS
jgi:hypothetical protein